MRCNLADETTELRLDCHGPCQRTGLPTSEFNARRDSATGYQLTCKRCQYEAQKQRRARLREAVETKGKKFKEYNGRAKKKQPGRSKLAHRRELKEAALKSMAEGEVISRSPRTFHFVLRMLVEEQLMLFHGPSLKTLPGKTRLASLVSTTMFAFQSDLHRLVNNAKRVYTDEKSRLQANPDLNMVERRAAYQILGLDYGSDAEAIKVAYREKAKASHPDRGGDTSTMQTLNAAYALLMEEMNARAKAAEIADGDQQGEDLVAETDEAEGDGVQADGEVDLGEDR